MPSIEIISNKLIKVNVDTNDKWSLNVIDSNFMLEKYNGIGTQQINIKTFSNVGDLFGKIELFVNNKLCNNYDLVSINNGSNDFFYIIPTIINLNGKNDTRDVIIYSSDNGWEFEILNNNGKISCSKVNNSLKITSLVNEIFYDLRIKAYSKKLNSYDYITVNQTYINETINNDVFNVSPKVLTFANLNEEKSFNVVTSCESGYSVNNVSLPFKKVGNNKIKLTSIENDVEKDITISSCGSSSTITLKYEKDVSSSSYLWINSEGTDRVTTSFTKINETDVLPNKLTYNLLTTSKVNVLSKPSNIITSISSLNNNRCELNVYFSDTSDFSGTISLRNYDGKNAIITLSINGFGDENGIVFNFGIDENGKEITKINMESSENDTYIVNFFSYHKKDKSLLKFKVYTNDFTYTSGLTNYSNSANATITLIPKDGIQGTKTIQLEEIETYKRLYITIPLGYNSKYFKFSFKDTSGFLSNDWYVVYDENGDLMSDSLNLPTNENIVSVSSDTLSFSNTNNTSYSPSSFTKTNVGIIDYLSGNENYYSSFTITQNESNNIITLYVTQIAAEACNEEYTYHNATLNVSGIPSTLPKCNANLNNISVTLNDIDILTNRCEEITSSITLTNDDYSITYIYDDTEYETIPNNNDDYEKEWIIRINTLLDGADFEEEYVLIQEKGPCFKPYYEFCIRTAATFTDCLSSETVSHNTSSDNYNITIRSRYYTAETSYDMVDFSASTNDSWITISGINYTAQTNTTTSARNGTITYTQANSNKKVYLHITQNAYVPQEKVCNMPSGSFDGNDGFKISFTSAVTSNVNVEVQIKDTDCNIVDTIKVLVNKEQKIGVIKDNENIANIMQQASQYFEITDVSPSSDDYYYYWGNGCDYVDSGNCSSKTKIKVIFNGTFTRMSLIGNSSGYGCDDGDGNNEYELYLPESIITDHNITYKIEGVTSVPSELLIITESRSYHLGHEDTGVTSFNPTSLSGTLISFNCDKRVSDEVCKNVEQKCSPFAWYARLSDYSKYDLEVIDNVKENDDDFDCDAVTISCNPTTAYTSGDAVRTTVTLQGSEIWEVETEKGIGSGETGGYFITSVLGEHKIYSHDCPSKYCTFTILDKTPILTGLYVQNNEPGNARIRVTINNEIVKNNDLLGRKENI